MAWRILLTVIYGSAFGAIVAGPEPEAGAGLVLLIATWSAAPPVGFVVGRWWVVLAFILVLIGTAIGGNPGYDTPVATWWTFTGMAMFIAVGVPLLLGVGAYRLWSRDRTGSWTPPGRRQGRWRRFAWTRKVPPA